MSENDINNNIVEISIPYVYRNIAKENNLFYDKSIKRWVVSPNHEKLS